MDTIRVGGNHNSNGEIYNCIDDKVCVCETVISAGFINENLHDTDNKQGIIHNYFTLNDENIVDGTVVGFTNENPYDRKYKQGSIHNSLSVKDENIDDLTVVVPGTELTTDCIDDKVFLNETVINGSYIKQEPCGTKDEQGSILNYVGIKDKNIGDLTVVVPETELTTDCIDDKVCINETVISGGYIKQEPCGMKDDQRVIPNYSVKGENIDDVTVVVQETKLMTDYVDNKACVYETLISGGYIKEEPCNMENKLENFHNVNKKVCKECGEEYDLYCLKCPMLIRIFDSNNPNRRNNTVRWTLPKNVIDICETPSGVGIVALRGIPKGVVFGPFQGLDSTKDDTVSKWKLENKELVYGKDPRWLNWMQYIKVADQNSHQNLVPFQYEGQLYYRSECHINVGDELLVCWDSDSKENDDQEMEDSYCQPQVCESLDDSYACTFCCVGYKSISHLKAHNSTCSEKRNKKDFCREIVQCDICKIYLDKKEYTDYHVDRCYKSNGKCVFNSRSRTNREGPPRYRIPNGDRRFSCTLCPYKATTRSILKKHIAVHSDDRPFACTLCSYKANTNMILKRHIASHSDRPFPCTLCPYKATTKAGLNRHIASHNNNRPFACTLCPYKAITKLMLKQHIAIHNNDRPFACTLCPYKATTKSILKQHVAVHSVGRHFACTLCPYKATTDSYLKQHIAMHNGGRPFACTLCSYKARTNGHLKKHMTTHNRDKSFACNLCLYKGTTKSLLKQHIATHNGGKSFACTICLYKGATKSLLKEHIVIHKNDTPFACTICPYKAATSSSLKRHVTTHNAETLACTFCPYKATVKSNLRRHIANHTGDKPFACTICPYKTTRNADLRKHIAVHTNDRPLTCTLCPYKTTTNSNLKQHIAIHSKDKPFACNLCLYKTSLSSRLKRHIRTHNDDKPFSCTLCSYKAKTNTNLKRHVVSHHN